MFTSDLHLGFDLLEVHNKLLEQNNHINSVCMHLVSYVNNYNYGKNANL
jgi:hypothetical protein